eukprot:1149403-Pelagomonas_calceolata.AAC.6
MFPGQICAKACRMKQMGEGKHTMCVRTWLNTGHTSISNMECDQPPGPSVLKKRTEKATQA